MSEVIEQESTELVTLPPKETALQVFTDTAKLDALLDQVRQKLSGIVYDMSTAKGRDQCRADAFRVARSKSALEKIGAAVSAEQKEIPKQIDAGRRYAKEALEKIQEQVREPLTVWEQAEEARVQAHKDAIECIAAFVTDCGQFAESARSAIAAIEAISIGPEWEEFETEAARAKDKALTNLRDTLAAREKYEAEQAELAKLRAEAEERRQRDERERIAKEAADQATREAETKAQVERDAAAKREADAKAAQAKAEQDAKDAVERQQQAEERAEAEKLAAAERARQAAEAARLAEVQRQADEAARIAADARKREADKAHKGRINRAALAAFIAGGMPEECAKLAVTMIAKGEIPAIRISY